MTPDIPPADTVAIVVSAAANYDAAGTPGGPRLEHAGLTAWRTVRALAGATREGGIQVLTAREGPAWEEVAAAGWAGVGRFAPATVDDLARAIQTVLDPAKPRPRRVILVLAGHSAGGSFYFDDHPAAVRAQLARLEAVPDLDVLVILDACSSSTLQGPLPSPVTVAALPPVGQGESDTRATLLSGFLPVQRSGGRAVEVSALSATAEHRTYGALLSYYTISGLKGGADLDHDGAVTTQELSDYVNAFSPSVAALGTGIPNWLVQVSVGGGDPKRTIPLIAASEPWRPDASSPCAGGPVRAVLLVDGRPVHDVFNFGGMGGATSAALPSAWLAGVREGESWQLRCFPYETYRGTGGVSLTPTAGRMYAGTGPVGSAALLGPGSEVPAPTASGVVAQGPVDDGAGGVVLLPPADRYAFERTARARLDLGVSGAWAPLDEWLGAWPLTSAGGSLLLAWSEGLGPDVHPNRSAARFALRVGLAPTLGPTGTTTTFSLDAGLSRTLLDHPGWAGGLQGSVGYGLALYETAESTAWTGGPQLRVGPWVQLRTPREGRRGPRMALQWAPSAWVYEVDTPPDGQGVPGASTPMAASLGRLEVDLAWSSAPAR